jgi:hypothetical protein
MDLSIGKGFLEHGLIGREQGYSKCLFWKCHHNGIEDANTKSTIRAMKGVDDFL